MKRILSTAIAFLLFASTATAFDAVGLILKVDAEMSRLQLRVGPQEITLPVAGGVKVLSEKDQPLVQGLRAVELKAGAEVTVTVDEQNGALLITAIRLGRRIPIEQASVGFKPLNEMSASEKYKGEDGGLYGGGRNIPPDSHFAAAKRESAKITPLDADGKPSANGTIALVSISMSNATQEFSVFKQLADNDSRKSSSVNIVDCAQGGQAMAQWVDPKGRAWMEADRRLAAAKISPNQVQVVWIKLANITPGGDLNDHGRKLYSDTRTVIDNARQRYPNLRIAYLGSRIYGGYANSPLNPEPYAYEGAYVVRWLIQDQIKGQPDLAGAPLLLWGPYFWGDGIVPRKSDALVWQRQDVLEDGIHPSDSGRRKVADMLLTFFTTDPLAVTWFVKK